MFALYATKKFGIECLSDKAVLHYCSGQSDETYLHPILQNIHENMKKCWGLSTSGRLSLLGSKWNLCWYFLLILTWSSIQYSCPFSVSSFPSESPQSDQVTSSCLCTWSCLPTFFLPSLLRTAKLYSLQIVQWNPPFTLACNKIDFHYKTFDVTARLLACVAC